MLGLTIETATQTPAIERVICETERKKSSLKWIL